MAEAVLTEATAANPMLPRVARVKQRRRELQHTWTLELEAGELAQEIQPGQFNMLYVHAVGEIPISLSGDPTSGRLLHTVRNVGAVSAALLKQKRGASIGIRGPFGSTWPLTEAEGRDVVIVAGGIGLAPLRPVLYRLFAEPQRYGRISLLFGSRNPEEILFRKQVERWQAEQEASIGMIVDSATADWRGRVGVVTDLVEPGLFDPDNAVAFICGPELMMRFSINRLMQEGLPAQRVYLSMERNMKCAIGHCGHCQLGPEFVCKDGPVFRYDRLRPVLGVREL